MKIIFTLLSLVLLATCRQSLYLNLKNNHKKQVIAIQPLGNFNESVLNDLTFDLRDFYNKKIIILKPIDIPERYYNTSIKQYSADSLIMFLSKFLNDSIAEIVGFIHDPVFITVKEKNKMDYYDENLFGVGHQPGNTCVVSDFKFRTEYKTLYYLRLRKVIIHEIGHNLGLSHCPDDKCVMSEKNGSTITLDNNGNDYCQKCKNILYQ